MKKSEYETYYLAAMGALVAFGVRRSAADEFAADAVSVFYEKYLRLGKKVRQPMALVRKIAIRQFLAWRRRSSKSDAHLEKYRAEKESEASGESTVATPVLSLEDLISAFESRPRTLASTVNCLRMTVKGKSNREIDRELDLKAGSARSSWAAFLRFVKNNLDLLPPDAKEFI